MKFFYCVIGFLFVSCNVFSQAGSFLYDNILRDYIAHLPTGYSSAKKYPLVINMHGLSSNASQQQLYTGFDAVADTAKFIVVYPNGIANTRNSGFNIPYNSGTDDVGFISALIDTLGNKYSIDQTRVYATGMSMGGFMSYRLACDLENKIAAIASVTGLMGDNVKVNCQSARPVPVMHIHGTTDAVVPYLGSLGYSGVDNTIAWWVQKNNCSSTAVVTNLPDVNVVDLTTATTYYYGSGQNSSEVLFYKITNGGHTWPGALPVISLGNTNQDFNASAHIWTFFSKHHLSAATADKNTVSQNIVSIYPNPTQDYLMITTKSAGVFSITITNLFGQVIYQDISSSVENGSIYLSTKAFAEGIYYVVIGMGDQTISSLFVKTN